MGGYRVLFFFPSLVLPGLASRSYRIQGFMLLTKVVISILVVLRGLGFLCGCLSVRLQILESLSMCVCVSVRSYIKND